MAAGPYPFEISVGAALTRLIADHPRLGVQLEVADPRAVSKAVLNGQVDVGVTDLRIIGRDERMLIEPLPMHEVPLACRPGHPMANRNKLTRAAVFSFSMASTLVPGDAASVVAAVGPSSGTFDGMSGDFAPAIKVNSHAIARQIAAGSDALVPGAARMLVADLEGGRLVKVNFHVPEMRTRYAIVTLRGRTPSPSALAFIALLRKVESEVVQEASTSLRGRERKPRSRRSRKR